jgi:hypothetical protein
VSCRSWDGPRNQILIEARSTVPHHTKSPLLNLVATAVLAQLAEGLLDGVALLV